MKSQQQQQLPAIPAAGGVLWRAAGTDDSDGSDGHASAGRRADVEVALVHRPRYDDWSLPKGKLAPGEYPLLGAVREVAEETGALVAVQRRLATVSYPSNGAPKRVSYWSMRYRSGTHEPGDEVDEIRWVPSTEAGSHLSYDIDRDVLHEFVRHRHGTAIVLLVRHAKAGKRSAYQGDDRLRPLDRMGRRQARDLRTVLHAFYPDRVLAADRVRCEQTVSGLADHLGLSLDSAPEVSDEAYREHPKRALDSILSLARLGGTSVICSQGEAIPGLLAALLPERQAPFTCRKGSVWALSFAGDTVVAADYYPRPFV